MITIASAVGKGFLNRSSTDNKAVQLLLNRAGAFTAQQQALKVDGDIGPKTIAAIEDFQKRYAGPSDGKVEPAGSTITLLNTIADEFQVVVATVHGEAAASSDVAKKAVLFVMKNRVGKREWRKHLSVSEIIMKTGFDAYTQRNAPYRKAFAYMATRSADKPDAAVESTVRALAPVYRGETTDITSNAVLYYSPRAQAALHKINPALYKNTTPGWNFALLKESLIPELDPADDFKFYAYK